jgi:hypothetical protein
MSADQWGALSVVVERAFDTPTEVCAGISRMRYLPYGASISGGGRRGHQDLHAGGTGDPWRGRDSIRVSNGVPRWGNTHQHSKRNKSAEKWSRRWDSNPRPADYESAALPTELRRLGGVIGARSQRTQTRHFSTAAAAGPRSSNVPREQRASGAKQQTQKAS